jgi:hypothetical protein
VLVSLLHRYYGVLRHPAPLSPDSVAFARQYHALRPVLSLPTVQVARPRARGSSPVPTAGYDSHGDVQDFPGSWGTLCSYAVFSDPGRTDASGAWTSSARPPLCPQRRLPRYSIFRGSIARLQNSLCTLRAAGCPTNTQHSLPAAGQLCRAGLVTRRIPMKGFRVVSLHRFPLSQALPGARTFIFVDGSCGRIGDDKDEWPLSASSSFQMRSELVAFGWQAK